MQSLFLVLLFIFVVIMVFLKNNEKSKRYQLQADVYSKALENGQPVSSDWFAEPEKRGISLKPGLICMAVGGGISLTMWLTGIGFVKVDDTASEVFKALSSVGIIPFLIGVAFVIIHFFEKKRDAINDKINNAQ